MSSRKGDREDWEDGVFEHAVFFTVIETLGVGQRDRKEFPSLAQAVEVAASRPRAMVYAIDLLGQSFMIPRTDWARRLAQREEDVKQKT